MPTGKIKWFNQGIGAGFIRGEEGENIFFRSSAIARNSRKAIQPGQSVIFEIARNAGNYHRIAASVITV